MRTQGEPCHGRQTHQDARTPRTAPRHAAAAGAACCAAKSPAPSASWPTSRTSRPCALPHLHLRRPRDATSSRWKACSGPSPPRAATPPSPSSTPRSTRSSAPRHGLEPGHRRQPHPLHRRTRRDRRRPCLTRASPSTTRPDLVDEAVRQATWEYATTLLARIGPARRLRRGHRPGRLRPRLHLLTRVLDAAGPGDHHLVCSVPTEPETARRRPPRGRHRGHDPPRRGRSPRIHHRPRPGHRHRRPRRTGHAHHRHREAPTGPRLAPAPRTAWYPLTAAEVFDAYCTDADIRRPRLPRIRRRLLRTTRPRRRTEPTTDHTH